MFILDQYDRAHSKEKLQLITIVRCNNITTTVNCVETDLPNLYINGGIDTIRTFSQKATINPLTGFL